MDEPVRQSIQGDRHVISAKLGLGEPLDNEARLVLMLRGCPQLKCGYLTCLSLNCPVPVCSECIGVDCGNGQVYCWKHVDEGVRWLRKWRKEHASTSA